MTIRDYIKRRFRNLTLMFALPYAALQTAHVVMQRWPTVASPKPWVFFAAEPRVFWILLAWFFVRVVAMPCPRCGKALGVAVASIWGNTKINRCPHCRVSLDQPMSS